MILRNSPRMTTIPDWTRSQPPAVRNLQGNHQPICVMSRDLICQAPEYLTPAPDINAHCFKRPVSPPSQQFIGLGRIATHWAMSPLRRALIVYGIDQLPRLKAATTSSTELPLPVPRLNVSTPRLYSKRNRRDMAMGRSVIWM